MESIAEHQYMAFEPVKEESLDRLQVAFHDAVSIVEMREPTLASKFRLSTTSEAVVLYSDEKDWFDAEDLFAALGDVLNEVTTVTKLFKITEGEFLFQRSGTKYRIYGEDKFIELRKCEETIVSHIQWGELMEKYKGWEVPFSGEALEGVVKSFNKAGCSCGCYATDTGSRYGVSCSTPRYTLCKNCLFHHGAESALADYLSEHGFEVTRKGFERMAVCGNNTPSFGVGDVVCVGANYWLIGNERHYRLFDAGKYGPVLVDSVGNNILQSWTNSVTAVYHKDGGFSASELTDIVRGSAEAIWRRSRVREMTVDEISKELGYTVKVIGEKK